MIDPDETQPSDGPSSELWAKLAEDVRAANAALAAMRETHAQWWGYSVSHRNFEMVVNGDRGDNNIVLWLSMCNHIAGPVSWSDQQLAVTLESDCPNGWPIYTLRDDSVQFHAVGRLLRWRQGYDIESRHGLKWGGRRSGPLPNDLGLPEVLGGLEEILTRYYSGKITFGELEYQVRTNLWHRLPFVKVSPSDAEGA